MNKLFLLLSAVFCIIIGFSACQQRPSTERHQVQQQPATIEIIYTDKAGTPLHAQFDNLQHEVTLAFTEQSVTLPKVVSASGVKYASGVEVFWTKGSHALYKRDGGIQFKGTNQ